MFSHQTELHDLKAKIAELEQSATTLQQLEELLRDGWLITCEYGPFWITNRDYDTHDPYPTLPAAIAAAWERRGE